MNQTQRVELSFLLSTIAISLMCLAFPDRQEIWYAALFAVMSGSAMLIQEDK